MNRQININAKDLIEMNESTNVIWMNQTCRNRKRSRSNSSDIITLMNRFLEITRKEWLIMNEARSIDYADSAYANPWTKMPENASGAEIIPLVSKDKRGNKNSAERMTAAYLNEKLAFFYNHGGPIMEL